MIKEYAALLLRLTLIPYMVREVIQRKRVTILCYHDISPIRFKEHVTFLQKHYTIISLKTFIEVKENGNIRSLPEKSIIITFDDGLKGNFSLLPIIVECNIPITIFLVTNVAGTYHHLWTKEVSDELNVEMKNIKDAERIRLMKEIGFSDKRTFQTRHCLSTEEINIMKQTGVDFQSHTHTHPILPNCSEEKVRFEMVNSKKFIEENIQLCYAIAYPNGDYSDREIAMAELTGYSAGLTIDWGYNDALSDDLKLRRIVLGDDESTPHLFAVQVTGIWRLVRDFIEKKI